MGRFLDSAAKYIICSAPLSLDTPPSQPFRRTIAKLDFWIQEWALTRADHFSPTIWEDVQRRKLHAILRHAEAHVPYWKKRLYQHTHENLGTQAGPKMESYPVMTRGELKKLPIAEVIDADLAETRAVEAHTSGSTGHPLRIFQDERDQIRRSVNSRQELRYALGTYRDDMPRIVIGLEAHTDLADIGTHFSHSDLENPVVRREAIYPYIRAHRPIFITGTGSLRRLAMLLLTHDRHLPRPTFRAIFHRGEYLDDVKCKGLSNLFGCEIFTTYGTRECSLLGIECAHHKLHTAPWMNYVEILRDDGTPAKPGEEGVVVVTFFENFVMPFIRYRIGDTGWFESGMCPCGRTTKTLHLSGREPILIKVPKHMDIPLLNLTKRINEEYSEKIYQYQFEEVPGGLIFRYIPNGMECQDMEEDLRRYFAFLTHNLLEITIASTDDILPNQQGKIPVFLRYHAPGKG